MLMETRKTEHLKKMTLIELKDALHRENELLKNGKLINKLPDRGESIIKFRDSVQQEIERRELQKIEESISSLRVSDKHIQKLCDIEKSPEKERYKPFSTLNKAQEIKPDSKVFKLLDGIAHTNKSTQLINLSESIEILKQQDDKVKEEQMKARHNRLLEKLEKDEEQEEADSDSENCEFHDNDNED